MNTIVAQTVISQTAANLIAEYKATACAVRALLNKGTTPAAAARAALSSLSPVIKARTEANKALNKAETPEETAAARHELHAAREMLRAAREAFNEWGKFAAFTNALQHNPDVRRQFVPHAEILPEVIGMNIKGQTVTLKGEVIAQ